LTVIANDLVPIVPYSTDSVLVSTGQRYDVLVTANAKSGDYWLRAGWIACSSNDNPDNITGIIRYDSSSTADPTTTSTVTASTNCGDEPAASLVPHLALDVGTFAGVNQEDLSFSFPDYFRWAQ
jgi:FtsP/CotA-like multicopper oxidase with cupredoxin domain